MARGASRYLRYRTHVAQEALLVGVEYRHQPHLGDVQTFAQQIHADEHVEKAVAQIFEYLHALQSVHVRVDVAVADSRAVEIFRKLLGHALGDGGDDDLVLHPHAFVNLFDQVVYLVERDAHFQRRVDQSRGANELLHDHAFTLYQLVIRGCRADVYGGAHHALELLEFQRTVILGGGESESVLHQILLAGAVAAVHGVHLRQGHVALVDYHQVIFGEIVEQAERAGALGAAVEVAGVVLDARAVSQLLYHLQIVFHPLLYPLRLHRAALLLEKLHPFAQIEVDLLHGGVYALLGGHEHVRGKDGDVVVRTICLTAYGVYQLYGFYFVVEQRNSVAIVAERRHNVHRVALRAECGGRHLFLSARIESLDQTIEQVFVAHHVADLEVYRGGVKVGGVSDTVQTRHARHHYDVPSPREQCRRGAQTHLLDIVVDRQVFLDVGVRRGEIGLGLVVIVIRHEIFDGVFGEKVLELSVQLRRERLVVTQYYRGTIEARDDVGYGECLSRTRNAHERVVPRTAPDRVQELGDSLGLVARRRVFRYEFEIHATKISNIGDYFANRIRYLMRAYPHIFKNTI